MLARNRNTDGRYQVDSEFLGRNARGRRRSIAAARATGAQGRKRRRHSIIERAVADGLRRLSVSKDSSNPVGYASDNNSLGEGQSVAGESMVVGGDIAASAA